MADRDLRGVLSADDYRRILRVLESAAAASNEDDLRSGVIAALEEQFGYADATFEVEGPPASGQESKSLPRDRPGLEAGSDLSGLTESSAGDSPGLLRLWLDTRLARHGYLSVRAGGSETSRTHRARLLVLRPLLAQLLRARLLQGVSPSAAEHSLTPRERVVARLVVAGWRNREIAEQLGIGEDTVKKHVYRTYQKLRVRSRTQLAASLLPG